MSNCKVILNKFSGPNLSVVRLRISTMYFGKFCYFHNLCIIGYFQSINHVSLISYEVTVK